MPKHGALTPKAISNRIKEKGLKKLRWYCEMCRKQCRDENGFKCHQTSESHLRQMRIYAENPGAIVQQYSKEFEENFIETLSRHHNTKRVHANLVYKEYIADKYHVHMNSTQWNTLSTFVQYLGKTGKCVVDETEKGWYIQWIDRDPAVIARQQAAEKKQRTDMDDEQRRQREINRRVAAASEGSAAEDSAPEASELHRASSDAKVSMSFGAGGGGASSSSASASSPASSSAASSADGPPSKRARLMAPPSGAFAVAAADDEAGSSGWSGGGGPGFGGMRLSGTKRPLNALEALKQQEERRKRATLAMEDTSQRKDHWLHPGIVVKVMNKRVGGGAFYKHKGQVLRVEEHYIALVEMLDSGSRIKIDQYDLETVIPKVGGLVLVVNGRCRGQRAEVTALDMDNFSVSLRVVEGERRGTVLEKVEYEDVSKLAQAG